MRKLNRRCWLFTTNGTAQHHRLTTFRETTTAFSRINVALPFLERDAGIIIVEKVKYLRIILLMRANLQIFQNHIFEVRFLSNPPFEVRFHTVLRDNLPRLFIPIISRQEILLQVVVVVSTQRENSRLLSLLRLKERTLPTSKVFTSTRCRQRMSLWIRTKISCAKIPWPTQLSARIIQ